MKKSLIITAAAAITVVFFFGCRKLNPIIPVDTLCLPCQNKVTFLDKNLEQAVRNYLGKPTCDICSSDLTKVTSLNIQGQVSNYSGFGSLTNLNTLTMRNCTIINFNFLAGMPGITSIDVTGCTVLSLDGLNNDANPVTMTVTSLQLSGCSLSDIGGLSKMHGLTWLSINNNNVTSVAALTGTANLTYFTATNNKLTSLAGLETDYGLNTIEAGSNQLTDISALTNLINLRHLELGTNSITGINALANLTALQYLDIGNNGITDMGPLKNLTSLTYLTIWHNEASVSYDDGRGIGNSSPLGPLVVNALNNGIGDKTTWLLMSYYNGQGGVTGPVYTAAETSDINYLISIGVQNLQYQF